MFATTFGGVPNELGLPQVPLRFEERLYGVRYGLQSEVTSPSMEIADDLTTVRMGLRNRWQTKRGRRGERRIVDWIVLDANATWFPKEEQNFSEPFGLVDYDFRWHLGERFTLLSDGYFDFYDQGGQTVSVGGYMQRPDRGGLYLGYRALDGPFKSRVIQTQFDYLMSPKWVSSYMASVDLEASGNVAHRFNLTRIGESLLVRVGFVYSEAKDLFGVNFTIEPRFLPRNRLANSGGLRIPPAGAFGLE